MVGVPQNLWERPVARELACGEGACPRSAAKQSQNRLMRFT
ncbi:hypothetical protein PMI18_00932 [Pseudomonas sp. GM102]|nr:hypothetical protein PMI18_00932 [Pseudomonas sp. GM102]